MTIKTMPLNAMTDLQAQIDRLKEALDNVNELIDSATENHDWLDDSYNDKYRLCEALQRKPDVLAVGDIVTRTLYTDSYTLTVIAISPNGKTVTCQCNTDTLDKTLWTPEIIPGGFSGHCTNNHDQEWHTVANPDGRIEKYSLRVWDSEYGEKAGCWSLVGESARTCRISKGCRPFHDYNF